MDTRSQETFDKIVAKPANELLEHDVLFLRARRSYLTATQLSKFKAVLSDEAEKEEVSYKALQSKASKLGMEKVVGVSREKLEEFIASK